MVPQQHLWDEVEAGAARDRRAGTYQSPESEMTQITKLEEYITKLEEQKVPPRLVVAAATRCTYVNEP